MATCWLHYFIAWVWPFLQTSKLLFFRICPPTISKDLTFVLILSNFIFHKNDWIFKLNFLHFVLKVKKTSSVEIEDLHPFNDVEHAKTSTAEDSALCTTSIFYSITSTQTGLQGIELGNSLIKQAVKKLKEEFPTMSQFSTLSPIPG